MITALKLFYVVGGVAFYYFKTELEPKIVSKHGDLFKDTIFEDFEDFDYYSNSYKVKALIGSAVWPIFLITNFAALIVGIILGLQNRQ